MFGIMDIMLYENGVFTKTVTRHTWAENDGHAYTNYAGRKYVLRPLFGCYFIELDQPIAPAL